MWTDGEVTLYSSCFAAMTLHYIGELQNLDENYREQWSNYILQWQDPETGLFIGPEIVPTQLTSQTHDYEHVTMHLVAHILPTLHILGAAPKYPLRFAHPFLDPQHLRKWLDKIDWSQAWLKGNDLLFIGEFLLYLRDFEKRQEAQPALDLYFEWLDNQVDSTTGLWGTNGYCDAYTAVYGGYHQLLVYYFCDRPVRYAKRIIDTVLRLQHYDGSFTRDGGGGACEDVDAVDILVNLYKRTGYRYRAVRHALQKAIKNVLNQQMPDGGFVYRRGAPFTHMGITRSFSPADTSNLFATWFRAHTIALCSQILCDQALAQINWEFNDTCSMGWHDPTPSLTPLTNPWQDLLPITWNQIRSRLRMLKIIRVCIAVYSFFTKSLHKLFMEQFGR